MDKCHWTIFAPAFAFVFISMSGCCNTGGGDSSGKGNVETRAEMTPPKGDKAAAKEQPKAESPKAAPNAPADQPAPALGDSAAPSELEFVEHKVQVDKAEGDPKKDAFNYFRVWGEVKNKSSKWVESVAGDIRYFDASGKELGIESISTAVKEDLGDKSPGERVSSDVLYVAPGAVVPLHHIRSLNKIGGTYASYKITFRPARAVTKYPEIVVEEMKDVVANVANEALENASPHEHRVVSGALKNKGSLGCRNPGLIVGFYDAQGKLADLKEGDASKDAQTVLAAGATMPVKVFTLVGFDDAWKAKATIKTWGRCSEPD